MQIWGREKSFSLYDRRDLAFSYQFDHGDMALQHHVICKHQRSSVGVEHRVTAVSNQASVFLCGCCDWGNLTARNFRARACCVFICKGHFCLPDYATSVFSGVLWTFCRSAWGFFLRPYLKQRFSAYQHCLCKTEVVSQFDRRRLLYWSADLRMLSSIGLMVIDYHGSNCMALQLTSLLDIILPN